MALCAIVMGLGTSIGGLRIIKSVGMDMVKLDVHQGFSADLAAAGCLLLSSVTGIPVSPPRTPRPRPSWAWARRGASRASTGAWCSEMVLTWVLTFPGCGLVGYLMAKLFMAIF